MLQNQILKVFISIFFNLIKRLDFVEFMFMILSLTYNKSR